MSISNDQPEEATTPHEFAEHEYATHEFANKQFAEIEKNEHAFHSSPESKTWGITGIVMASAFFIAILVIGGVAEHTLNHLAPNKPVPTTGMQVEQSATTPIATPAYPTVYVQESADPSQAPSPLPPTPVKN